MRVRDRLAYMARLHGADAGEAGKAAERWTERLGLAARAEARVEELSLGNQQRVQLGAALVHEPDLLVLDEPFSGLDPEGVDVLASVLGERAQAGVPVVFSSHQLELVERLCDAVAIVNAGRVVAAGAVEELRDREGGRTVRIELEGPARGWTEGLAGVERVEESDGAVLVTLNSEADDQRLLDAARGAGRVHHFGTERPSLAEIFREAVAGPAESSERT